MKCIVLLSTKSAGSTACASFLAVDSGVHQVSSTRHRANETLYWVKAASVLGRPQMELADSEVPIEAGRARADLVALLSANLDSIPPANDDEELIFSGWHGLCRKFQPVFLEKSPHHIYQWSALELIMECMRRYPDVEFVLLGLIRNPMDTIYSAFKRWGTAPETLQYEWLQAYTNLRRLMSILGSKVHVVRYEDLVSDAHVLAPVLEAVGVDPKGVLARDNFHRKSVSKWKTDKHFGFVLDERSVVLAESFGYSRDTMTNSPKPLWPLEKRLARVSRWTFVARRNMRTWLRRGE